MHLYESDDAMHLYGSDDVVIAGAFPMIYIYTIFVCTI